MNKLLKKMFKGRKMDFSSCFQKVHSVYHHFDTVNFAIVMGVCRKGEAFIRHVYLKGVSCKYTHLHLGVVS